MPKVETLINELKDHHGPVRLRCEAARKLGTIGDARAVEPLVAALKDRDRGLRVCAASALGAIKDPRAAAPLIVALNDKDEYVRLSAAKALDGLESFRRK